MHRTVISLCAALVTLSACGDPAPELAVEAAVPGPYVETPAPAGAAVTEPAPAPGETLPPSQITPGPIPIDFRNVWAVDKRDCKAEPALTRIAIAPGAIRFYEGRAVVVTANTNLEGTVALEVDHISEGTTNREAHTLALNPAKTTLTYDRNGEAITYVRCD